MRFEMEHYYPESPYNVEVKSISSFPLPPMQEDGFDVCLISEIIYKTTVYVSGKRKIIKHHDPVSIPGYCLELDKTWVNNRKHSNYSSQLRLEAKRVIGEKLGVLYLDEVESYGTYDLVERDGELKVEGEGSYDGCVYAGFMMKEVSVDEIKKMKYEAKYALK
jgi:hypothetical protein